MAQAVPAPSDNDEKSEIVVSKVVTAEDIAALDDESKQLLNHKAKYSFGDNNTDLTFYPSPHLYDDNGEFDTSKLKQLRLASIEAICERVGGTLGCNSIESTFIDEDNNLKNMNVYNDGRNAFISAALISWSVHYPLKLDPNHIWLLILQGVALHVDKNAEALRSKWVMHQGKKKLEVIRDNFVKGARTNEWSGVIEEFCEQIDKNTVENTVELLDANFSNASIVDKIAAKVTIMDICKNYFEYGMMTCCGYPSITLTGTKEDWVKIYNKTKTLLSTKVDEEFGKKWGDALLPVLARFVCAFDGEIDCLFWNSMIKQGAHHGSGGYDWYSGWLNIFFPIIKGRWNRFCVPYSGKADYIREGLSEAGYGNDVEYYSNGLSSAPVTWNYLGQEFKLKFIGGFVGVKQDENSKALSPVVGWVIGEKTQENAQAQALVNEQNTQQQK